jgi:hypothetical protein
VPKRLSLLLLVVALLGTSACSKTDNPAVEVNGRAYSDADFVEELDQLAGNEVLLKEFGIDASQLRGKGKGTYSPDFADSILSQRVQYLLFEGEREKRGVKISAADRTQAKQIAFSQPDSADQVLAGFSKAFAKRYIDDIAGALALQADIGEDQFTAWISTSVDSANVKVNPRYGRWDKDARAVVPPDGPKPPPGATTTTAPAALN